jgi:hypothetical protein
MCTRRVYLPITKPKDVTPSSSTHTSNNNTEAVQLAVQKASPPRHQMHTHAHTNIHIQLPYKFQHMLQHLGVFTAALLEI